MNAVGFAGAESARAPKALGDRHWPLMPPPQRKVEEQAMHQAAAQADMERMNAEFPHLLGGALM
jgi:hypothetical protein